MNPCFEASAFCVALAPLFWQSELVPEQEQEPGPSRGQVSFGPAQFATTHWSVVMAAGQDVPQRSEALEKLCRTYWYPLYAYVRRRGFGPEDAQDLTQEFFARL